MAGARGHLLGIKSQSACPQQGASYTGHPPPEPGLRPLAPSDTEPTRHSQREEVVGGQLERVAVAEAPQDGPRGLMAATLDEECVQEEEACSGSREGDTGYCLSLSPHQEDTGCQGSPSRVSRSSRTPPATFLRTTIFTSSRACGARGCPKQDFCLQENVAVSKPAVLLTAGPGH